MYLQRELEEINAQYLAIHKVLTEKDVQRVNACVSVFENAGESIQPQPGDLVCVREFFHSDEDTHPEARIERIRNGKAHICLSPLSSPHVKENEGTLSISGGRWVAVPLANLKFVERKLSGFWVWGEKGHWSSGGALTFNANVRAFECTVDQTKF